MIDVNVLDDLLQRMLSSGMAVLDVEYGGARILMRLPNATQSSSSIPLPMDISTHTIGVFHLSHPRRPLAAAKPGDSVVAGQPVGYLQVGPTLSAVVAPADGTIADIAAREGEVLGFGARVMTINKRG